MGISQSKMARQRRATRAASLEPSPTGCAQRAHIFNDNQNINRHYGNGDINNYNPAFTYIDQRPPVPPASHTSDVSTTAVLPPKPVVFYGRDIVVADGVRLLTGPSTARVAILGAGGMGKTTVALALLHDPLVGKHFGANNRLFISCEALTGGDALIIALAKLLDLPISSDLLAAVVAYLTELPRILLVLDNLETVWLAGGSPILALDELLGRLAQIPSLSLIITCRGRILPGFVDWSNSHSAELETFALGAALETFQDKAGYKLKEADKAIAEQLLSAVDKMPLAVSLLGQLARRGNLVSDLFARWNREHSALLQTHGAGRINNVDVSIGLSIAMVQNADESGESLHLLSLCCMLPDGLHPGVFNVLRAQFQHIDRARDNLSAYALASLGPDQVLRALSPVRHIVLERHPAQKKHRDALHSIYFGIANRLPVRLGEDFKQLAASAALEMGNLSSLLLTLVSQPSAQVVDAVIALTSFADLQQPTATVVYALLPHVERHPQWKARCLQTIGGTECALGHYSSSVSAATTAANLFTALGDRASAATCKVTAGHAHRLLGELDRAVLLLNEAQETHAKRGDKFGEAMCGAVLGDLMRMKGDYSAAIKHAAAAKHIFGSLGDLFQTANCTETLGVVYTDLGELASGAAELESAHQSFVSFGHQGRIAQSARFLGTTRMMQGSLTSAEQSFEKAQTIYEAIGDRYGLADCAELFGYLRTEQRPEEAVAPFESAIRLYETLNNQDRAQHCRQWIQFLQINGRAILKPARFVENRG